MYAILIQRNFSYYPFINNFTYIYKQKLNQTGNILRVVCELSLNRLRLQVNWVVKTNGAQVFSDQNELLRVIDYLQEITKNCSTQKGITTEVKKISDDDDDIRNGSGVLSTEV